MKKVSLVLLILLFSQIAFAETFSFPTSQVYGKTCTYIWDSTLYKDQEVKITTTTSDASGAKDSDSVSIKVTDTPSEKNRIRGIWAASLDIGIASPTIDAKVGAVKIEVFATGPYKPGEIYLSIQDAAPFPISESDCVINVCTDSDRERGYYIQETTSEGISITIKEALNIKGYATGKFLLNDQYYEKVVDECTLQGDKTQLKEWSCVESGNLGMGFPISIGKLYLYYHDCSNGCKDGACFAGSTSTPEPSPSPTASPKPSPTVSPSPTASPSTCTDTDAGINLYKKGSIKGSEDGIPFVREDKCSVIPYGETILEENYCFIDNFDIFHEKGDGALLQIKCTKGCSEGRCLGEERTPPPCIDSDGGKNYNLKGQIKGPKSPGKEEDLFTPILYKDFCTSKLENGRAEYSCQDGLVTSQTYACPQGCKEGQCITSATKEVIKTIIPCEAPFIRGDANQNGNVDISDTVYISRVLQGEYQLKCQDAADANDDSYVDEKDYQYLLSFLFEGGPKPPEPYPFPGVDEVCDETDNDRDGLLDEGCIKSAPICEKYYKCPDGREVQYCFIHKTYNDQGEVVGAGCGCKSDPSSLCEPTAARPSEEEPTVKPLPTPGETPVICDGCILENKCVFIGYRIEGKYCDIDSEFVEQKEEEESCDNNFECSSNVCINNECISQGILKKILDFFRKLFGLK